MGEALAQLGQDLSEIRGSVAELREELLGLAFANVAAKRLNPGPVGGGAARFPAPTDENARTAGSCVVGQLLGEPALADPGFAGQEVKPSSVPHRLLQAFEEVRELLVAADEDPGGLRQGTPCRWELQSRVLAEDRVLEFPQRLTRLDPELLDERPARLLVRLECLGLPPRPVERQHPLPGSARANRVLGNQQLEL